MHQHTIRGTNKANTRSYYIVRFASSVLTHEHLPNLKQIRIFNYQTRSTRNGVISTRRRKENRGTRDS